MQPIYEQLVRSRVKEMYDEAAHRSRVKEARSGSKYQRLFRRH